MADHPSTDDLADAAEGLLDPDRAARVAAHAAGCARCQETAAALARVSTVLAGEPAPVVPEAVARRLADVLAAESAHRTAAAHTARGDAHPMGASRPTLGHFDHHRARAPWWRRLAPALAVAGLAAVVGFGGYVASATAGLNEPPLVAVALSSDQLGSQARTLAEDRDLDPHRFSHAWLCARAVTAGRITGLARASVDGSPALLVYTRSDGVTSVTAVTGCNAAAPAAVASAAVPR